MACDGGGHRRNWGVGASFTTPQDVPRVRSLGYRPIGFRRRDGDLYGGGGGRGSPGSNCLQYLGFSRWKLRREPPCRFPATETVPPLPPLAA